LRKKKQRNYFNRQKNIFLGDIDMGSKDKKKESKGKPKQPKAPIK
jgi:hypothetical protein